MLRLAQALADVNGERTSADRSALAVTKTALAYSIGGVYWKPRYPV